MAGESPTVTAALGDCQEITGKKETETVRPHSFESLLLCGERLKRRVEAKPPGKAPREAPYMLRGRDEPQQTATQFREVEEAVAEAQGRLVDEVRHREDTGHLLDAQCEEMLRRRKDSIPKLREERIVAGERLESMIQESFYVVQERILRANFAMLLAQGDSAQRPTPLAHPTAPSRPCLDSGLLQVRRP